MEQSISAMDVEQTELDVGHIRRFVAPDELVFEHCVSIHRPRAEVFQFWRKLENLVLMVPRLKKVEVRNDGTSHWVVRSPLGVEFYWNAHIVQEVVNEHIARRSLPDSQLPNAGSVHFEDRGNGVTQLWVTVVLARGGRNFGETLIEFMGENPHEKLHRNLIRCKRYIESYSEAFSDSSADY